MKAKKLPRMSIALRLWGLMMILILLAVAFMWIIQIFLFEQNYIDAAVGEVDSRLSPIAEELKTTELSNNMELLHDASKSVRGKTLVFDENGNIFAAYSNSHPIAMDEVEQYVMHLSQSSEFQAVLNGEQYKEVSVFYDDNFYYEIGIPVKWQGKHAVLFLNHPIEEVYRVQTINRRQLVTLSILLTTLSGVLAWILSKQFVKPIQKIKSAVKSLAEGDLKAKPDLKLKDELGDLSDSVGELSLALQRVDILRREVIANVSHELSSPLSLIIGYGEMVRDVTWKDDEERNDNLNLIISEAQRMNTMVEDITDYSQFQAGYIKLHKAHYNLYEIVESEVIPNQKIAKDFGITIEIKCKKLNIPVYLDALKISQVMRNLLNNAINHTEDNETIVVKIELNDKIKVSVNNPGKPIPDEKKEMIWERYYSSQHKGTRKGGTGIGLSIVSTILDAHGYVYGVDYVDGFNCFWFEIDIKLSKRLK